MIHTTHKEQKTMKLRYFTALVMGGLSISLTACSTPKMLYNPDDFIPANAVANEKPGDKIHIPSMPEAKSQAEFIAGNAYNTPEIKKVFQEYMKDGTAQSIKGDGFITLPYNKYKRPIIQCAPLQVCQIKLQKNEVLNDVAIGDSLRWTPDKIYEGTPDDGSWIVILKPTEYGIATNLSITTDRRIYNLGLLSAKEGDAIESPMVDFWYPSEMAEHVINNAEIQKARLNEDGANVLTSGSKSIGTYTDVKNLNFNYSMDGDSPEWKPAQIFDDGNKTFIRMPPMTDRVNLPILYVYKNDKQQMINYRYKRPYIIYDGLFDKAVLISDVEEGSFWGKVTFGLFGDKPHKTEVDIINNNFSR